MLIGLQFQGENVAGICRFPALDEVVWGLKGAGAWWEWPGKEVKLAQVRRCESLAKSLCCYSAVDGFDLINRPDALRSLSRSCKLTRGWGDCYGHMLVATGRADIMVDPLLEEWDAAALIPIIQEAGGLFMNWDGGCSAAGGNGISLVPALQKELLQLIGDPVTRPAS
jgi:histidinol-phosphatase